LGVGIADPTETEDTNDCSGSGDTTDLELHPVDLRFQNVSDTTAAVCSSLPVSRLAKTLTGQSDSHEAQHRPTVSRAVFAA
jgi:hypothetical protein